ncbi:MAG: efflux RND transporter periplasmic adaptor subunit [Paludibacter sp.]|jgi:RND family efflux transporter MFP subunit|nr:efflux RND transporter periplasmic adaptor subunit [Paludibacter sp.]
MKTGIRIFVSLVVMGSLIACGPKNETAAKADANERPAVQLQQVNLRDVDQVFEFTATVEPVVKNNINPTAPGRIRSIFVEVGDQVTKGQRLAQMDAVNLMNSETQLANLKRNFERVKELFAVGGASQQELDNVTLQLTMAETNLKNLQENTMLLSPVSGIVTARNYDSGDMYAGQQPILTVMQINPVQTKINVSEVYFSKVKRGMPVKVKLDVYPNQSFAGKVKLVYPTIDERTRTFPVEIEMNNPGQKIRPGMFARVGINFGKVQRVVVPDRAIVKIPGTGTRYVYTYADGKVSFKAVELGRRMDTEYELISGVANGEQVVISGQSKLNDGTEVVVAN